MIEQTSIQSYMEIQAELGKRQLAVYKVLYHVQKANNTMLSVYLALPISSITPRVRELVKMGKVECSHIAPCPYTKRNTKFWKVK